ncbi:hypothetical protein H5410_004960, partial [Solanum commersonii]
FPIHYRVPKRMFCFSPIELMKSKKGSVNIADAPVRRCEGLVVEGTRRGKGRPKKYWGEVIRQDLAQLHLTEDMTLDRKEWRSRIKVEGSYCWRPPFQLQSQTLSLPFTHDNMFSHSSGLKFEEEEEATHVVHLNIMSSFPRLLGPSVHFISNRHISFSTKPANKASST